MNGISDEMIAVYENPARHYCLLAGLNPELQHAVPNPNIHGVMDTVYEWQLQAMELIELSMRIAAIRSAQPVSTQVN